jgi:DNA-binding GntR family transcriptional regulator
MSGPKYKTIADDIRRRIAEGEWEIGEKIPSISQLMETYEVPSNLNMIRHAQSVLIDEGLLRAEQGRGVFVAGRPGKDTVSRAEALEAVREAMRLLKRAETALEANEA